jgi:hypothetical protein
MRMRQHEVTVKFDSQQFPTIIMIQRDSLGYSKYRQFNMAESISICWAGV